MADPIHTAQMHRMMRVDGKKKTIASGMAVDAEIITGDRRIIDCIRSPLLRCRHESGREMRSATPVALAAAILLLFAGPVSAQVRPSPTDAVAELRNAATVTKGVHQLFRREVADGSVPPDLRDGGCRKLAQAVDTLLAFGPLPIIDNALRNMKLVFSGKPEDIPATLAAAAERCRTEPDARLTLRMAGTVGAALASGVDDIEAEIRFGPLLDNASLYGAIKRPQDGIDLLRNLKFALDQDVVLRRDFFAPENLARFFGVRPMIFRNAAGDIRAFWSLKPAAYELRRLPPGVAQHAQWQYSIGLRISSGGKKAGWISVSCNYPSSNAPTFEDVEQEFGTEWQDIWELPRHGPPPPRTAPRGNTLIQYTFDGPPVYRKLVASFGPNADFTSLSLTIEER
jgi:hypothetical protein